LLRDRRPGPLPEMRSTHQHVEQHADADGRRGALLVLLHRSSSGLDGVPGTRLVAGTVDDAVTLDALDVYDSPRVRTPNALDPRMDGWP
jgi:hypothetical protein